MIESRVVLITGGGRGLGRVMALALLNAGHRVVLSSTDQAALDAVAAESGAGDRVTTMTANLAKAGEAERLAEAAAKPFGPIDILVNNAGISMEALRENYVANPFNFWEADRAVIERFFQVNSISPMILAALLAPAMIKKGWGRIIGNTTSLDTMLRLPLYGGSKAAQEAELSVMAHNLAGTGVTANVLVPGGATGTRMTDIVGFARADVLPDTIMAAPIVFLASNESDGFTGRRVFACYWPTDKPPREAAAVASDPIAWTGFGRPGVQPASSKSMFRRDSGVGG